MTAPGNRTPAPGDVAAIALLEQMVRIPSLSGQERPLAEYLAAVMADMGYEAEVDAAGNAVGHLGSGLRHVALVGHMDTVPGEVPVRREGSFLYGRGAVDAKGPLAAFIVAAARVGAPEGLRVTVVGAVEEEAATSKGARYVASRLRPDYCVIGEPSGASRVTLGYKGRLLIDYRLERPMAHSAGEAPSAAEEAVNYWLAVRRWADDHNVGKESRFARVDPSLRDIETTSDGLMERVDMRIGLRLPPGLAPGVAIEQAQAWRTGEARVSTTGEEQAFYADKRSALAAAFLAAIRAEGERPAFVTKTGTSDMNVLGPAWGCPIVAYGPGDSAYDHTPDEQIDLDEYLAGIRVLERVLRRLAAP